MVEEEEELALGWLCGLSWVIICKIINISDLPHLLVIQLTALKHDILMRSGSRELLQFDLMQVLGLDSVAGCHFVYLFNLSTRFPPLSFLSDAQIQLLEFPPLSAETSKDRVDSVEVLWFALFDFFLGLVCARCC